MAEADRPKNVHPIGKKNPNLPFHPAVRAGDFIVISGQVPKDEQGNMCAGTIEEQNCNQVCLTVLASRAKIIHVSVLDPEGFGTARNIAKGIRWAANHKAQVINMSFEFSLGVNSCGKIKGICSAVKYAFKKGALVVAAAGNENGEPVAYPAGVFVPPVATKLTQSPWFLKTPKVCQPPFLHSSFEVGSARPSTTTRSPLNCSSV